MELYRRFFYSSVKRLTSCEATPHIRKHPWETHVEGYASMRCMQGKHIPQPFVALWKSTSSRAKQTRGRNRHHSRARWLLHLRHAVLAEDMTWRYSSISVATSTSSLRHVWMSARCDRMNSCAKAILKPSLTFRRQRKLDALG